MAALLRDRAADLADAPFLLAAGEAWSFSDAAERAARRAGTLRATGVEPGDRVVALLPNGPLIVELLLACAWSGAVLVPVNTASRGPQLAHVIGDCEPKLVVADAAFVEELASVVSIENGSTPLWVAGDPSARSAVPSRGSAAIPRDPRVTTERSARDPLHLRDDRAAEGRHLPARSVLVVGPQHR